MLNAEVLVISLAIFCARVLDVSLGTLRTMTIVRGRRRVAFLLGFLEVFVWVFAVARVIDNLTNPIVAIAYALGFATGSVVGMTIERHVTMGQRVVRVLTHPGRGVADALRAAGFTVASLGGQGTGGSLEVLYVQLPKRDPAPVVKIIRELDPDCFYVVEEVRASSTPFGTVVPRTGWLSNIKRK